MIRAVRFAVVGLAFLAATGSTVAFAAAKDDVKLMPGSACGAGPAGTEQVLHNQNSEKAIRATVRIHSPKGARPDPQNEILVPAGGQQSAGCSSNGDGDLLTYSVVGADYARDQ